MLRDLIEAGTLEDSSTWKNDERCRDIKAALVVVCKGSLRLRPKVPAGQAPPRERFLKAGNLHWTSRAAALIPADDPDHPLAADVDLVARASSAGSTNFFWFGEDQVTRFLRASPLLAATVDSSATTPRMRKTLAAPSASNHTILLCQKDHASPEEAAILEPLAHLLAAALSSQFDEPTAVVTFDPPGEMKIARFGRSGRPRRTVRGSHVDPFAVLEAPAAGESPLRHTIYVTPEAGVAHPRIQQRRYHRIAYLTDERPAFVPPKLLKCLYDELTVDGMAYFSAFVASILLGERIDRSKGLLETLGGWVWSGPSTFESIAYKLDGKAPDNLKLAADQRIDRDSCRLRFDRTRLLRSWTAWKRHGERGVSEVEGSFSRWVTSSERKTADRWARALTNRRVGLALSGGGAASYRLVPVIRALEEARVPIDVVGGISGGALLAAYYCAEGAPGLQMAVDQGPELGRRLPLAALNSRVIEDFVDGALGNRPLDDLEVRCVALAATTNGDGRPEAHAITKGTLGEAVRASGAAPIAFSPTEKQGHRFTDGTVALAIPARLLKEFGADFVFE
jgi:hypothetical protein